jgi:hypothetical protein
MAAAVHRGSSRLGTIGEVERRGRASRATSVPRSTLTAEHGNCVAATLGFRVNTRAPAKTNGTPSDVSMPTKSLSPNIRVANQQCGTKRPRPKPGTGNNSAAVSLQSVWIIVALFVSACGNSATPRVPANSPLCGELQTVPFTRDTRGGLFGLCGLSAREGSYCEVTSGRAPARCQSVLTAVNATEQIREYARTNRLPLFCTPDGLPACFEYTPTGQIQQNNCPPGTVCWDADAGMSAVCVPLPCNN